MTVSFIAWMLIGLCAVLGVGLLIAMWYLIEPPELLGSTNHVDKQP